MHWVDENTMTRRKPVLACRRLKGRHTHDVLAKQINDIHWDFQIEEIVAMTTTDNGRNFVKVFTWVFYIFTQYVVMLFRSATIN